MKTEFRIGTRGSKLALYQSELVKAKLERNFPLMRFTVAAIKTSGDMIRRSTIDPFRTKRVYTKEIEEALVGREIDLAVHSAKDLAVELPDGLKLGAFLEREDSRDCLVAREGRKLSELPLGARIGTSSLRRRLQLLRMNSELIVEEIRGNVDSRLRKVEEGQTDGIVLAYAGLQRLGLTASVTEIFPEDKFYPAPGQGIIAIESREKDPETDELLSSLNHAPTAFLAECERAFLRRLEGGCQLPCGITTRLEEGGKKLAAAGILFSLDGGQRVEEKMEFLPENPEAIGTRLAEALLEKGGDRIVSEMRRGFEK